MARHDDGDRVRPVGKADGPGAARRHSEPGRDLTVGGGFAVRDGLELLHRRWKSLPRAASRRSNSSRLTGEVGRQAAGAPRRGRAPRQQRRQSRVGPDVIEAPRSAPKAVAESTGAARRATMVGVGRHRISFLACGGPYMHQGVGALGRRSPPGVRRRCPSGRPTTAPGRWLKTSGSQRAQGDVVGGPGPMQEGRAGLTALPRGRRRGPAEDPSATFAARPINARPRARGIGSASGSSAATCRPMGRRGSFHRPARSLSVVANEAAEHGARRSDGHLLTDDGAHRHLEAVDVARHP